MMREVSKALQCIFCLICVAFFSACGSKDVNPLAGMIGKPNDADPLKIGSKPTIPAKQPFPKLLVGKIYFPNEENKNFTTRARPKLDRETLELDIAKLKTQDKLLLAQAPNVPISDWVSLLSPGGAALTVWALAQGNWLWGYTLIDSAGFGGARVWRFHFFPNDEVLIENGKTGTCVNAYKNGVIHSACNEKNKYQRFKLIPMTNEAFMLKNVGMNKCLQTPIGNVFGDFHKVSSIFLSSCAAGANLDQQWYVVAPPFLVRPLYKKP